MRNGAFRLRGTGLRHRGAAERRSGSPDDAEEETRRCSVVRGASDDESVPAAARTGAGRLSPFALVGKRALETRECRRHRSHIGTVLVAG